MVTGNKNGSKPSYEKQTFRLSRVSGMPVEYDSLLADLRRVAESLGSGTAPLLKYRELGAYDDTTPIRRFGSWNKALLKAGLSVSNEISISDQRLFENLLLLWQHYGRQSRRSELAQKPSTISQTPYNRRFGSWTSSLEAFINYANSSNLESVEPNSDIIKSQHKTGRDPSLRLRWKVLQRDRFTCCSCGASPALKAGVELHVDHVFPWSNGGETVFENLKTRCQQCNLGKSNLTEVKGS